MDAGKYFSANQKEIYTRSFMVKYSMVSHGRESGKRYDKCSYETENKSLLPDVVGLSPVSQRSVIASEPSTRNIADMIPTTYATGARTNFDLVSIHNSGTGSILFL